MGDITTSIDYTEKIYSQVNDVPMRRRKVLLIIYTCLIAYVAIVNTANSPGMTVPSLVLFLSAVMLISELFVRHSIKENYKQYRIAKGNTEGPDIHTTVFGEKITTWSDVVKPVVYDYTAITGLYRTKDAFLIGLSPRVFILADVSQEEELTKILLANCPNIKKKKVISVADDKTACLIISIVSVAIAVVNFAVNLVLMLLAEM